MPENIPTNPALEAAQQALENLYQALREKRNFIFEAGAGAGKTYSLAKALSYLIEHNGKSYMREHKRIACITYTNVAKAQIDEQIDKHPVVHTDTINAFCWSVIRNYQEELRKSLSVVGNWQKRLAEYNEEENAGDGPGDSTEEPAEPAEIDYAKLIGKKEVIYQLGYPSIDDEQITLHHDDVLHFMIILLCNAKFRSIFTSKYPIILIDEYQDTFLGIADALQTHFINSNTGPQIGFFGDHWQKIYGQGCGKIENEHLTLIPKNANFRSAVSIVNILNAMRPELPQQVKDAENIGTAQVYHTNLWQGTRRTGGHWAGDLPAVQAHDYLLELRRQLERNGWDFDPTKTKILMLTHNVLAQEQGYKELADVFSSNEAFIKKEDSFIAYFLDYLEPICDAFDSKKFGQMFSIIGSGKNGIGSHSEKNQWSDSMTQLSQLRATGTIGDVLDFLATSRKPKMSQKVADACARFTAFVEIDGEEIPSEIKKIKALREVPYSQVKAVRQFVNEHTPFATKHSVKGDEFENVLVVVGRGWNQYNFDQMLAWFHDGVPAGKEETFERSRNLFYVSCSRPKQNLAIIFTQLLSTSATETLNNWFGTGNVIAMNENLPILN